MIKYDSVENHNAYVGTTRRDVQCIILLSKENHGVPRGESRRGLRSDIESGAGQTSTMETDWLERTWQRW